MRKSRGPWEQVPRVQIDTGAEGGAKQEFKDEADINVLMGRYLKGGAITHLNPQEASFLDVSEIGDYRELLERGRIGTEIFERLPSDVREEFDHDPIAFLDFAADPANADELVELGILPRVSQAATEPPADSERRARDEPDPSSKEEGWSRDQPRDPDGRFSADSGEQPDPDAQ